MSNTVIDDLFTVISNRTRGYVRPNQSLLSRFGDYSNLQAGQLYNAPLHDTSMKIPGGGLLSTPCDLVKFAIALNTGKLLSRESLATMWTSQVTSNQDETGYGLGWRIGLNGQEKCVWHTGGQAGTSTILYILPESGTSVAIMCNLQSVGLLELASSLAQQVSYQPPAEVDYNPAIEKLRTAVQYEVLAKQLPALSISIVEKNRIVWAKGFGHQDADKKTPATENTVYRVGSVSKLFTDIAVMQQVEDGKLDLDQPIQELLPEFQPHNAFGESITLRQLMTHRSGLVRESPIGNYFDPTQPSLASTVTSLNQTSLVYAPNTRTKYSNAAVAVVGTILEHSSGSSHPQQVRTNILDPLGMEHSSFEVSPEHERDLATGWMHTYDDRRFEAPNFLLGTGPAGNLYSSVTDLSKFMMCIFEGGSLDGQQIISSNVLEAMLTPQKELDGTPQSFGIGFHIQDLDGYQKVGHGGAIYGFSTQLEALPERKIGVVAASALDGSNGVVGRLSDYALRLMLAAQDGKPLPNYETTTSLPSERATAMVGSYEDPANQSRVQISEYNGRTFLQRGSFRRELRARDSDGGIIIDDVFGFGPEVRLEQPGMLAIGEQKLERQAESPPADAPQRWKGLIGEYGWDHNTLYILEDGQQLVALIEWFYYYPLTEIDENTYLFPNYGLYHGEGLKFSRNEHGIATKVTAAEVEFFRREVGTRDGQTFKITPLRPIEELREVAQKALPPEENGDFRPSELVEVVSLDPSVQLDIRYATTNNFTGSQFYQQARAFLQRPAAEALIRVHKKLSSEGLGLLIHDAYRPWYVTKMFWDATPDSMKDFVANPARGSRHNRGCAVDLTLYDLRTGQPIPMVAGYDEFSPRSFPLYPGGTNRQRWYRELLRTAMQAEGFTIYEYEWWHFDFKDWRKYRIGNLTFEQIPPSD